MFRRLIAIAALLLLMLTHNSASAGDANLWWTMIGPWGGNGIAGIDIGAQPGYYDGYDGQYPVDRLYGEGIALLFHKQAADGWPEGFYYKDFESPIPAGGSHTWSDIYLWGKDYAAPGNLVEILFGPEYPPPGYTALLELDYVPEYLNYSGPTRFWLDLSWYDSVILPVAEVEDGLQGTRMHITVYAPPIPEPSSLLALAGGVLGLAGLTRRRRPFPNSP